MGMANMNMASMAYIARVTSYSLIALQARRVVNYSVSVGYCVIWSKDSYL